MLWCYLDDSGTDRTTPTVTMAGYVAPFDQWRPFEVASRHLFKRHKLSLFHAKDLHDRDGDFEGWPIAKELGFIQEWFDIAHAHVMAGITVSMARVRYETHRKTTKALPNRSAYGHCFDQLVNFLLADDVVGDRIIADGISFFVEAGAKGNAGVLDIFNKRKATDGSPFLQQLSFIDKNACRAIQLADFLAFQSRRHGSKWVSGGSKQMPPVLTIATRRVRTIAQLAEDFVGHPRAVKAS